MSLPLPQNFANATARLRSAIRPLWANPIVTRDLRVQLRGTRSYWHQAAYLLLLGLLAEVGYATATSGYGTHGMSVVQVQERLQVFYYFIFMTLATLVCLIAPALTAASITTERQRLSLDLLVTTPLSASELLVGKLVSSVAFLALLLTLSLPASALCVILGGATLGDVLQVYTLLAIDGLVFAAIGLYFSCAVRASLLALIWTYLSLIAFLLVTSTAQSWLRLGGSSARGSSGSPELAVAALNPFFAVWTGAGTFTVAGTNIPIWVGTAGLAFLVLRLLVTAASYRLESYGRDMAGSLRRQVLVLTGLNLFLVGHGPSASVPPSGLEGALIAVFLLATPFLPGLFTPAAPEDVLPGQPLEGGSYRWKRAFRPEHAGALPFFHLWLGVLVASFVGGVWAAGSLDTERAWIVVGTAYYLSGLGFLFWALARRASTFARGVSGARALVFGLYAVLAALPLMILTLTSRNGNNDPANNPVAMVWLFYPLMNLGNDGALAPLWLSGSVAYVLGVIVFPFWQRVIPGGLRK